MSKRSQQRNRHLKREQEREDAMERAASRERVLVEPLPLGADERNVIGEAKMLSAALPVIARANGNGSAPSSKQPRFQDAQNVFTSTYRWVKSAAFDEPVANANSRVWDAWFRKFMLYEPLLTGVINSIVQIDKNRGWTLTGGRNQVARYLRVLHGADDGAGWRSYLDWQAQSFYYASMGFVSEVGRDSEGGPLRALWSVDPTRCELTGNPAQPLRYFPRNGSLQLWQREDYFRAASLVSTDEAHLGLGVPAVRRMYELAKIMVGVWEHDKEQLGARAPRGLLLLHGITQDQWNDAMQARAESLDAMEREYYGAVAVLASAGVEEVQAQLVALSQLPKDFDTKSWTDLLMYGYALIVGYDPREFWPVSSGSLGTATETETQHRKASSKGDLDFSLAHQEQLQRELPEALHFEYEQRDVGGELADAQAAQAKAAVISEINKLVVNGANVFSADEIRQLLARERIIPQEWTEQEEDVQATDRESELERMLTLPRVRRACEVFSAEPIVQYSFRSGSTRVLWQQGSDALRRKVWRSIADAGRFAAERLTTADDDIYVLRSFGYEIPVLRSVKEVTTEYDVQLTKFVNQAFAGDMSALDLARAHRALIRTLGPRAFAEGLREGGVNPDDSAEGLDAEDQDAIDEWVTAQVTFVREFAKAAVDAGDDRPKRIDVLARVLKWIDAMRSLGAQGKMSAQRNALGTWEFGDTEDHCDSCSRLAGQRHRVKWFRSKGFIPREPGSETLECGGWNCDCRIVGDDGRRLI